MRIHYDTAPARITLADVAREAGVVPATLVQRFGSKRGLLEAALRMGLADLRAGLDAASGVAEDDPRAALDGVVHVLMPVDRTPTQIANTIAQLHLELSDPGLRPLVVEHMVAVREAFAVVLAAMREAGQVSDAVGPRSLAEVVTTAWSGALVRFAIEGEAGDSSRRWIARAIGDVLE